MGLYWDTAVRGSMMACSDEVTPVQEHRLAVRAQEHAGDL
jgi:hypothetical protein